MSDFNTNLNPYAVNSLLFTDASGNPTTTGTPPVPVPTLSQVLASGNDAGAQNMTNMSLLLDGSNIPSVDVSGRLLYDASTQIAVNWLNRVLNDSTGNASVDWLNRSLFDASNLDSVDYQNRILHSASQPMVDWSGAALVVSVPLEMTQTATPSNPASGDDKLYFKSDDKLYAKSSAGVEVLIGPSAGGGGSFPASATMFMDEAVATVGTIAPLNAGIVDHSQLYNYGQGWTPNANGNTFTLDFFLAAGTYTMTILGYTDNVRGIVDWYIDNVLVFAGTDWYSASSTYNVVKTNSVTVTTSGQHVLKGVMNGKNASSSDYGMFITKVWIR